MVRFEISGKPDCDVYVTNVGTESLEIAIPLQSRMYRQDGFCDRGRLEPDEVLSIYPVEETAVKFYRERMNHVAFDDLSQAEINRLLSGE